MSLISPLNLRAYICEDVLKNWSSTQLGPFNHIPLQRHRKGSTTPLRRNRHRSRLLMRQGEYPNSILPDENQLVPKCFAWKSPGLKKSYILQWNFFPKSHYTLTKWKNEIKKRLLVTLHNALQPVKKALPFAKRENCPYFKKVPWD